MKCWEFMKCGCEKGGKKVKDMGVCPAWPDKGKSCVKVDGTFCGGQVQGAYAIKLYTCSSCDYYQSKHYDKSHLKFPGL